MHKSEGMEVKVSPDKLYSSDRRYLLRLSGLESREIVDQQKISDETTIVKMKVEDEVWTYFGDEQIPAGTMFNVRQIKNAVAREQVKYEVYTIDVPESLYTFIAKEVEEDHVERLKPEDLKNVGLTVITPFGTSMLIDGNHRLVKRWRNGDKTFRTVFVEWKDIQRFIFTPTKDNPTPPKVRFGGLVEF